MIIISAMSENRVIGSGNGMPWSVPAEYEQYLRFVTGQAVIMGRRTYEIFGPDLTDSTTKIVVTRRDTLNGVQVAGSLESALHLANDSGKSVFVAGGAMIYRLALPIATEMYLSTIKGSFDGDTYFPDFSLSAWKVVEERDEVDFIFRKYQRRS